MSITGGAKILKRSKCLYADGTSITATSGLTSVPFAIDRNPISFWRSVASDDTVTEELVITFDGDQTIDRLFLVDHNWKDFNVQYDNASVWTHFTSVIGIDGAKANITETAFADDTAYYEFASVTTGSIRIQVTKTMVVDAQKYINQIIVTEELGTLQGFPKIKGTELDRNIRKKQMLSGKVLIQKSEESFAVNLEFDGYPASLSNDIDLLFSLHDREDNFILWLCGGRRGSTYFKKQLRGYRLRDVFTVQMTDTLKPIYTSNIYQNSVNFTAKFEEAVD